VKGVIIKLEDIKIGKFNKNNIIILNKENKENKENKHFIYNFCSPCFVFKPEGEVCKDQSRSTILIKNLTG
jgi:hypothetical protein